jgi:hypothetical protein
MKKIKTDFINKIGDNEYPIYLTIDENRTNKYDLECEYEIYALAWYDIYEKSVKKYEKSISSDNKA